MRNIKYTLQLKRHFMYKIKINLNFELLITSKETHPIRLIFILLLNVGLGLFLSELADQGKNIGIIIIIIVAVIVVNSMAMGWLDWLVHLHWLQEWVYCLWVWLDLGVVCIVLSFYLVSQLILYVWALDDYFLCLQQYCYFAFPIPQVSFSLRPNSFSGSQCLSQCLVLDQYVCFVWLHSRNFELNISNEPKFLENFSNVMLVIVGMLVLNGGIDNRDQIINILIINTIRYNIPSFHMISKKYLEIGVVSVVNSGVYGMVLRTCIGSILHPMEFYICEIANYLYFLYLSILLHYLLDEMLVHLLKPAYEQFANQYALVYFLV